MTKSDQLSLNLIHESDTVPPSCHTTLLSGMEEHGSVI